LYLRLCDIADKYHRPLQAYLAKSITYCIIFTLFSEVIDIPDGLATEKIFSYSLKNFESVNFILRNIMYNISS
jgi:hypothetical protein